MDKKQREARQKQEDIALTRALFWVAAAIVLEGLLVLVNRFYINYYLDEVNIMLAFHSALRVVRVAGLAVGVIAVIWTVVRLFQGKKIVCTLLPAIAGGVLAVCSHVVLRYRDTGISMLFWLVIGWAVLALIYYIYQKEFFLAAVSIGLSILGLWFLRYGGGIGVEVALVALAIIVVSAATLVLKKNDGALPLKKPWRFLPKDAVYSVVLASCAAALVALIAAVALGSTVAYYLIFVMMAWIFALFVYYTVKLM